MKIRKIYEEHGHSIEFVKVDRVPGRTHRVIIDGTAVDWFSDLPNETGHRFFRVGVKTARFYLQKHTQGAK